MAGYQKESGVCTGRGFSVASPNGYLAKFYTWVTKAYVDGGPQWYIIDDFSTAGNTIFAYISVDATADTITVTGHGLSHGHEVRVSSTGTVPGGLSAGSTYYVIRVDANKIKMASSYKQAMAGHAINLTSQGTGIHTLLSYEKFIVISDTAAPLANDYNTAPNGGPPKIIKVGYRDAEPGCVRVTYFMAWNTITHKGYGQWGAPYFSIGTYDDADFAYDFRGGEECMILQSRLGTSWYSQIVDDWEGMAGLVEDTSKIGILQNAAGGTGTRTLQLGTSEAANFTVNSYYYIMDFNGVTQLDYVKVTARDLVADTVTVENLSYNFATGSLIGAYIHRWYANQTIPYLSDPTPGYAFSSLSSYPDKGKIIFDYLGHSISRLNPDDLGYYSVMRPVISEYGAYRWWSGYDWYVHMNRSYGRPKNLYITRKGSMAAGLDGRTINGDNWLYFLGVGTYGYNSDGEVAVLLRDSTHTS